MEPRPGPVTAVHGHAGQVAGPQPAVGVIVGATFKPRESQEEAGFPGPRGTQKPPSPVLAEEDASEGAQGPVALSRPPQASPKGRAARGLSAGRGPVGLGRQALSHGGWAGAALAAEDSPCAP